MGRNLRTQHSGRCKPDGRVVLRPRTPPCASAMTGAAAPRRSDPPAAAPRNSPPAAGVAPLAAGATGARIVEAALPRRAISAPAARRARPAVNVELQADRVPLD